MQITIQWCADALMNRMFVLEPSLQYNTVMRFYFLRKILTDILRNDSQSNEHSNNANSQDRSLWYQLAKDTFHEHRFEMSLVSVFQ